MKWQAITIQGRNYNLDHLHPFAYDFVVPAKGDKPERKYHINVIFSLHCFTRGRQSGEVIPAGYSYKDNRETRIFDLARYEKSFDLPGIVTSLSRRKCFHDPHDKFYVVEFINDQGQKKYYAVFFELSKAGKKKGLNLYISSAYVRDDMPYGRNLKPIRFDILVHNIHTGKRIRRPHK